MLNCVRFALVAVALLSSITFAGPAVAGMISTPEPVTANGEREAAMALLTAGTGGLGLEAKLAVVSDRDLVTLAATVQSLRHAGHGGSTGIGIAVGVIVIFALVLVILETYYP